MISMNDFSSTKGGSGYQLPGSLLGTHRVRKWIEVSRMDSVFSTQKKGVPVFFKIYMGKRILDEFLLIVH